MTRLREGKLSAVTVPEGTGTIQLPINNLSQHNMPAIIVAEMNRHMAQYVGRAQKVIGSNARRGASDR